MSTTRRAVIYTRISRDREGAGLGVTRQHEDCQGLADRLGWEVVGHYSDNDISAYSGKPRPGYRALLDDLHSGKANAVIVWHTDRLHRSPRELEEYIDVCEPRGVVTHTVKAGDFDLATPTGRAIARTLGAWARQESEQKSERIRRQKMQAVEQGLWRGGGRPFGYEPNGITIREEEAARVREAAQAVIEGRSLASLIREFNEAGVRTSTGGAWRMDNMRNMLRRPRNAGLIEVDGQVAGLASWEPVLDEDTWRAVVSILDNPARRTNNTRSEPRWLGSGIYRCGVCGEVMRSMKSSGKARAYMCSVSRAHVSRIQEPVDDLVRGTVVEILSRPDTADLLAADPDAGALNAARQRAEVLRERQNEVAGLYAEGALTAEQLKVATAKLRADLEATEREIAAAAEHLSAGWLATAPDPAAAFMDATLDRQRAVVDTLLDVTILKAPRGRPPGWKPGALPWINPDYVSIREKGKS